MRSYLRQLRREKQMTQTDTAKRAGMAQGFYCAIEQGKKQRSMSFETIQKLARAFDLQPTEIFQLEAKYQQDCIAQDRIAT